MNSPWHLCRLRGNESYSSTFSIDRSNSPCHTVRNILNRGGVYLKNLVFRIFSQEKIRGITSGLCRSHKPLTITQSLKDSLSMLMVALAVCAVNSSCWKKISHFSNSNNAINCSPTPDTALMWWWSSQKTVVNYLFLWYGTPYATFSECKRLSQNSCKFSVDHRR